MRYSTTGEVAHARKSSNKLDSFLAYSQHCGDNTDLTIELTINIIELGFSYLNFAPLLGCEVRQGF